MKPFAPLLVLLLAFFLLRAEPLQAQTNCRFMAETGFTVCDDAQAQFLTAFNRYGVNTLGYPISRRYERDGFVTQAFQKAILQWRPDGGTVAFVNVFDLLSQLGMDERLYETRQTPYPLPAGWDGTSDFAAIRIKREALLADRPAIAQAYYGVSNPLDLFGLPTSTITDMGNHYALRTQRAVFQEWKETVLWAQAGQVTIANGGTIAREMGLIPEAALAIESAQTVAPPAPAGPLAPQAVPAAAGQVGIDWITYDGAEYRSEGDEYAVIKNYGNTVVNLGGWRLYAGDPGQSFVFPSYDLAPGASCRVYTNRFIPETCGFSFGRGSAIWNNSGDCGVLYNADGVAVDEYCY
jgi:hypothetical protein